MHKALETARAVWPEETSPSKLLARLALEGQRHLLEDPQVQRAARRRAWDAAARRYPWRQPADYLDRLREDWE